MSENAGNFAVALNMSEQVWVVGALPLEIRVLALGVYRVTDVNLSCTTSPLAPVAVKMLFT
jgi:hypothetical protein